MRRKAAFGVFCLTTVYPTSTHGAHGNSGDKSAGKDVFGSRKEAETARNKRKQVLRNSLGPGGTEFKSPHFDQIGTQVLIRYLRSFSFCQKWLGTRIFGTFANEIYFIVSKLTTLKSKLSDTNLPIFNTQSLDEIFLKRLVSSCPRLVSLWKKNFIVRENSLIVLEKTSCF